MITTFSFPTQIRYGIGAVAEIPEWLKKLGCKKPLVVTDGGFVKTASFKKIESLGGWAVFSGVHPNPVESDVEGAVAAYEKERCDSVLGVGGGSALDVAKVMRLRIKRPDLPLSQFDFGLDWTGLTQWLAIPTTAGTGSEVGRSSVIIIGQRKKVIFHPSLLATGVVLDPQLTEGLPPPLTAATGADALTHCIESFTSPNFHPLCDGIALEGMRLIVNALPRAYANGADLDARGEMQVAAMMGGIAFQKDLGATHSLAHPLSSLCGLHHGLANALCLPAVMRFNAHRKKGVYHRVALALEAGNDDLAAIRAVTGLFQQIGLGGKLREHGVTPGQVEALTEQALEDACHKTNPVPVSREDFRALYHEVL